MKCLVAAPIGHDHVIQDWVHGEVHFDLALLDYTAEGVKNPPVARYYKQLRSFKWHMLADFLPEVIDQYDYFWFPDDDIVTTTADINRLFELFAASPFVLAQPALTLNSFYSWRILLQKGKGYRRVSHVEVMCPIMTRDTVKKLLRTFKENQSSWGYDLAWTELLNRKNIGVLDQVAVWHSKPVGGRSLYQLLDSPAHLDRDQIIGKYDCKKPFFKELPHPFAGWWYDLRYGKIKPRNTAKIEG